MNNDIYTLEKLNEYRQAHWDELDRQGRFIIHDEIGVGESELNARNRRLIDKLYGFFRKRRSRKTHSKSL
ncbi:hypothetical protein HMPREF9412_0785 [Paenibacillus sp. HGF5]|nr:hypothetical protein HMPREF9412_0785 [Paenibacillus sp. HGF5]